MEVAFGLLTYWPLGSNPGSTRTHLVFMQGILQMQLAGKTSDKYFKKLETN